MTHIVVIGGAVLDINFVVDHWPKPGGVSTVEHFSISPGGKGLNQAVAVQRLGASVDFVTCIGRDETAEHILKAVRDHQFKEQFIIRTPDYDTNVVGIIVEDAQPGFMGRGGASFALQPPDTEAALSTLSRDSVLLINFEVQEAVVAHALQVAKARGATTILNPGPLHGKRPELPFWSDVDFLIPNEMEANTLIGTNAATPDVLIESFVQLGVRNVVLTLGADGCRYATAAGGRGHVPAFNIDPIDTTGASDAFCGAFAVHIVNCSLEDAARAANGAGAVSCLRKGALDSMPHQAELDAFLQERTDA